MCPHRSQWAQLPSRSPLGSELVPRASHGVPLHILPCRLRRALILLPKSCLAWLCLCSAKKMSHRTPPDSPLAALPALRHCPSVPSIPCPPADLCCFSFPRTMPWGNFPMEKGHLFRLPSALNR